MSSPQTDAAFLKALQQKTEQTLRDKEIEVILFWKERLDRLAASKPEGIAPLKVELQKLSDMMKTRIATIKKGLS